MLEFLGQQARFGHFWSLALKGTLFAILKLETVR